jgi:transcriptional regulator with XRE-family HTH domain
MLNCLLVPVAVVIAILSFPGGCDMAEQLRRQLGERIKKLRQANGLTQAQLAEIVGLSDEFVSRIERGAKAPSIETMDKLARTFSVPVRALFDFSSSSNPELGPAAEKLMLLATTASEDNLEVILELAAVAQRHLVGRPDNL